MLKTYTGSCHCGAVRFEADIDLSKGSGKCNCSICLKTRNWSVVIQPSAFRLLTDAKALSDYQFATKMGHHVFCRHCGCRPFGRGHVETLGGDFVAVQLTSLDNATPEELVATPVRYTNGRDNKWEEVPAETRHL